MKSTTLTTLAALGFLAMSGNVFAGENGHAYNGSYCNNYFGSEATQFNHQWDGIRNISAASRYVSCPVIVDEIANTSGTTQVWVHWTGAGTLSCYLNSKNGSGTNRQTQSNSRVNTGWLSIPNITSDDYWGSYSMYCYLPASGTLNTVWVGEKT